MAGIDINRSTSNVVLNPETSNKIWEKVREESSIMKMAQEMPITGKGKDIQMIVGDASAATWVDETGAKPNGVVSLDKKRLTPYKVAYIIPFSEEMEEDLPSLVNAILGRGTVPLGHVIDKTIYGAMSKPQSLSDFDTFAASSAVSAATDLYGAITDADVAVASKEYEMNGIVFSTKAKAKIYNAKDQIGRPLFLNDLSKQGFNGSLLGFPVLFDKDAYIAGVAPTNENAAGVPEQLGVAGDWNQAVYGRVGGVRLKRLDQATITINNTAVNLAEHDMIAYRIELRFGFRIMDKDAFVRITGETPDAVAKKASNK